MNFLYLHPFTSNNISDEMQLDVNMFWLFMIPLIFSQMDSTLTITINGNCALLYTNSLINPCNHNASFVAFVKAMNSALVVDRATKDYKDALQLTTFPNSVKHSDLDHKTPQDDHYLALTS